MLANKKSAQTLVFIAFVAFITNSTAKSGFNNLGLKVIVFMITTEFSSLNHQLSTIDNVHKSLQ